VIKDALFVVDDFAPYGSSREVAAMHGKPNASSAQAAISAAAAA
jgi:hypothetical protein